MNINETVEKYLVEESLQQKYEKVKKVIKSCKTKQQCDVAYNMVVNFEAVEAKESDEWDAFILRNLLDKQYKKVTKKGIEYHDNIRRQVMKGI